MATVGRLYDIAFKSKALVSPMIQTVRYRKPRWLPIAKSKEFYVREPTPIDPDEYTELKLRYSNYRSTVKSIRNFLKKELTKSRQGDTALQRSDESADIAWMEQQTQEWNQKVALTREKRQIDASNAEHERLQQLMKEHEQRKLEEILQAEKRLQNIKTISRDLITEENLDQEIEKMLDSRSDYNYALSRDGEILEGEYPSRGNSSPSS